MKKLAFILSMLTIFIFSGVSCVKVKVGSFDGGVYKTIDKAEHWEQKVALLSIDGGKSIAGVDVLSLVFDPQDSQTLYLGTKKNGLFVSYNGGDSWQSVEKLPAGPIKAIGVNPQAKHIIYVAIGGRIFKSNDCCRNWQNVYLEATGAEVLSLAIDPADYSKILAGLSDGRLLRSVNGGASWATMYDFQGPVKQILINPKNSGIIYIVTAGRGLWRSADGGANWQNLDEYLRDYSGSRDVIWMIFDPTKPDSILTASNYGLLRSDDGGRTWFDYKLLLKPGRTKIYSFAINPKNPNEIYYSTATTLYKSSDDGKNWRTKSLPSKRAPIIMLADPNNPNVLYLGVQKIEK